MSFHSPTSHGLTKKLAPIRRDPVPEIPCTVTYCKGRNKYTSLSSHGMIQGKPCHYISISRSTPKWGHGAGGDHIGQQLQLQGRELGPLGKVISPPQEGLFHPILQRKQLALGLASLQLRGMSTRPVLPFVLGTHVPTVRQTALSTPCFPACSLPGHS